MPRLPNLFASLRFSISKDSTPRVGWGDTGQRPALAKRGVRKALLATTLAVVATSFLAVLATAPEGAGLQAPSDLLPKIGEISGQAQQPPGPSTGSPSPAPSK